MGEGEKRGRGKKFFLWAFFIAIGAAVIAIFRRRRHAGIEEGEWQELPPAEGG